MAIVGLVLDLVGLLFLPIILPVIGLVLGIVGLVQANSDPRMGGKGIAIAAIVLGPICFIVGLALGAAVVESMNP